MSHIFDALQRAEAEKTGSERPTFSFATELLEAAEEKMREAVPMGEQQARAESPKPVPSAPTVDDLDSFPVLPVAISENGHLVSVGREESLGAEKFRFLAVRLQQ